MAFQVKNVYNGYSVLGIVPTNFCFLRNLAFVPDRRKNGRTDKQTGVLTSMTFLA